MRRGLLPVAAALTLGCGSPQVNGGNGAPPPPEPAAVVSAAPVSDVPSEAPVSAAPSAVETTCRTNLTEGIDQLRAAQCADVVDTVRAMNAEMDDCMSGGIDTSTLEGFDTQLHEIYAEKIAKCGPEMPKPTIECNTAKELLDKADEAYGKAELDYTKAVNSDGQFVTPSDAQIAAGNRAEDAQTNYIEARFKVGEKCPVTVQHGISSKCKEAAAAYAKNPGSLVGKTASEMDQYCRPQSK
jgi:hypothetical protein